MPATKVAKKSVTKKRATGKRVTKKGTDMPKIRMKAKALGITPGKMKKVELVHTIQVAEGYTPCFGSANGQCPYTDCCFMADCLKIKV